VRRGRKAAGLKEDGRAAEGTESELGLLFIKQGVERLFELYINRYIYALFDDSKGQF
jgi:hypothetical protein